MNVARDGLGALTPFVEDLEATAAFYRDVLDLKEIHQDDVSTVFHWAVPWSTCWR